MGRNGRRCQVHVFFFRIPVFLVAALQGPYPILLGMKNSVARKNTQLAGQEEEEEGGGNQKCQNNASSWSFDSARQKSSVIDSCS